MILVNVHGKTIYSSKKTFIKHLLCAKHFSPDEKRTLQEIRKQILTMKYSVGSKRGTCKSQGNPRKINTLIFSK